MENKIQTVHFEKITESSVSENELYKFCKQLSLQGIQTRFCRLKGRERYCLEAVIPVGPYQKFWVNYVKELSQKAKVRQGKIHISPYSMEIRDQSGKPVIITNLPTKFDALKYLANRIAAGIDIWQLGDLKNVERCTFNFSGEKQIYPVIENKMRKIWNGTYKTSMDLPYILENSLKIAQNLEDICIVSTGTARIVSDARPEHEENRDYKILATLSESTGELLYSFPDMSPYAKNVVENVQKGMIDNLQNGNKLKGEKQIQLPLLPPKKKSYRM